MVRRRELERRLESVVGFADPDLGLEQYTTPAAIASTLVHEATLRNDLRRPVVDLGTGTGILAIGVALVADIPVIGLDVDPRALATAAANERALGVDIDWICADIESVPLCPRERLTVLMNPPFGAQLGNRGADRAFLDACGDLAACSYSIHNQGSRPFIESYASQRGGSVTHA